MKKEIKIKGMSCSHCQARVESVLNALSGVSAKVNLKKETAIVKISGTVSDEALIGAITGAGYEVISICEKKGLFS